MSDHDLRAYLLGRLDEAAEVAIEERYLTQEEAFEQLRIAEDELIEDYLRDELSEPDRLRFEQDLLSSPARRERLELIRGLMAAPRVPRSEPARAPRRFPLPAAAGLLAAAAALLLWLRQPSEQLPSPAPRPGPAQQHLSTPLPSPVPNASLGAGPAASARLALAVAATRGAGEGPSVTLGGTIATLELEVPLEPDDRLVSYRGELVDANGRSIHGTASLRKPPPGIPLMIEVPASRLATGAYALVLNGAGPDGAEEPVESYPFRVVRPASK